MKRANFDNYWTKNEVFHQILNGKLHFLCSGYRTNGNIFYQLCWKIISLDNWGTVEKQFRVLLAMKKKQLRPWPGTASRGLRKYKNI